MFEHGLRLEGLQVNVPLIPWELQIRSGSTVILAMPLSELKQSRGISALVEHIFLSLKCSICEILIINIVEYWFPEQRMKCVSCSVLCFGWMALVHVHVSAHE